MVELCDEARGKSGCKLVISVARGERGAYFGLAEDLTVTAGGI